jgi:hypothetical protein
MNPEPRIGKIGRYEILEKIGQGGMAVVYRGHDSELDREVAVKVLPETLAHDQQFVQRFREEAIMAGRLRHPNIVTIYDVGQVGNSYYIVMQYLDGANLDRVIECNGALPIETAVAIAWRVAAALDAAHQHGVIHRDVKPSNIMISPGGAKSPSAGAEVTLTDFGLVRAAESSSHITRTGAVIGTPEYMSPEQAQGESVDKRTDVYSLGLVVYKMLNGLSPFGRSTPLATLLAQTKDPVPFTGPIMGRVPREVRRVLERALAKNPADRYPTAGALAADLAKAAGVRPDRPIVVRMPSPRGVDDLPVKAAVAAVAGAAPTALIPPAPPGAQGTGGTKGPGGLPPDGVPAAPVAVGGRPAEPGRKTWLFALIPLVLLVVSVAGYSVTRTGSRPAASPEVAAPATLEEQTATRVPPALEPTATLAAVGPAPTAPTATLAVVGPAPTVPTETAVVATSTPVVIEKTVVVVATSTPLITPKVTASPSPAETRMAATSPPKPTTAPVKPTAVASPRPQPTRGAALPAPVLINPQDGVSVSGPLQFEWSWSGPPLDSNQGFEVLLWRENQPDHYGAAAPTGDTSVTIDVRRSYAVQQGGTGTYLWTVALVQRDPYARLSPEASPRVLLVPGEGGDGGGTQPQPW